MPGGSEPLCSAQVYGVVPPVACSVSEYARLRMPVSMFCGMPWRTLVIAIDSICVATCGGANASCTRTVNAKAPVIVGVPEIRPVAGSRLRPGGKLPDDTDQVYGESPPVALSAAE